MNNEGKMRKSGSAIIIAFLLMSVVSGVAFAIARLFYLDTAQGGLYENSMVAYYAAESGVEEGLLRYRFDRNAEVAETTSDYTNYNTVNRNNLVTGKVDKAISKTSAIAANSDPIYDLNMFYKAKYFGTDLPSYNVMNQDDINGAEYESEYKIARDEAIKIDVTSAIPNSSADLNFFVKPIFDVASGMSQNQIFIEAKVTNRTNEYKKVLLVSQTTDFGDWTAGSYINMNPIIGSGGVYQVSNLVTKIAPSAPHNGSQIFLSLKPVGCSATIGIAPTGNYSISAPYSSVKSTGYYGGVSRTLTAKIDRQSGTVYDIFDFVTYQHQ